jgi:hypothetical protein
MSEEVHHKGRGAQPNHSVASAKPRDPEGTFEWFSQILSLTPETRFGRGITSLRVLTRLQNA